MAFAFPTYRIDAGDAYERGRQHGEIARAAIDISVQTYRRMFQDFVKLTWDEAKTIGTGFEAPIAAFDPELLAEIHGIADGSGFERAEILALNARSEIALSSRMLLDGCTAIAAYGSATPNGETVLCQNWDWRATQREALVALEVERPGSPVVTMLTEAGIIGKIGFNSSGLGICLNAIVTDQMNREGTPLHVVLRKLLECTSIGEAIQVVAGAQIASAGTSSSRSRARAPSTSRPPPPGSASCFLTRTRSCTRTTSCSHRLAHRQRPRSAGRRRLLPAPRARPQPRGSRTRVARSRGSAHDPSRPRRAPEQHLPSRRREAP